MSRPHKIYGSEYDKNKIEDFKKRKQNMFNDLETLCKQKTLSKQTIFEIVRDISWSWTDGFGNGYQGCAYWTEAAIKQCYGVSKIEDCINKFPCSNKGLRHEHVVPKNLFIKYIMDECYNNLEKLDYDLIDKNLIGCVVTNDEAKNIDSAHKNKMPDNQRFDEIDDESRWSRYTKSGVVNVYKIGWYLPKNGKKLVINKYEKSDLKQVRIIV